MRVCVCACACVRVRVLRVCVGVHAEKHVGRVAGIWGQVEWALVRCRSAGMWYAPPSLSLSVLWNLAAEYRGGKKVPLSLCFGTWRRKLEYFLVALFVFICLCDRFVFCLSNCITGPKFLSLDILERGVSVFQKYRMFLSFELHYSTTACMFLSFELH